MINALFVSVKRNILQIAKHFLKAQKATNLVKKTHVCYNQKL